MDIVRTVIKCHFSTFSRFVFREKGKNSSFGAQIFEPELEPHQMNDLFPASSLNKGWQLDHNLHEVWLINVSFPIEKRDSL